MSTHLLIAWVVVPITLGFVLGRFVAASHGVLSTAYICLVIGYWSTAGLHTAELVALFLVIIFASYLVGWRMNRRTRTRVPDDARATTSSDITQDGEVR